jgi:superfamily I DNA/RNA helicase
VESVRSGAVPVYRGCATATQEQTAVVQFVRRFREQGLADRDIAVLYPRREWTRAENLVQALRKAGEVCWITDPDNPLMRDRHPGTAGVRVSTIHSAKGLEFPAVILACLDQLPGEMYGDEAANLTLLYVGLTRACDHLALTWVGRSDCTRRIEASGKARPWTAPSALV